MSYNIKRLATFIKFKRLELSMSQRDFAKRIYVSHGLIDSIENGKLLSLDSHIDNIFKCFKLDRYKYTDEDGDWIIRIHNIIHQTIYFELPTDNEKSLEQMYYQGIENSYLYLYYQLTKVCLYARQYINDDYLQIYFPIFDVLIGAFDQTIQQYYQIMKYTYYKEKRRFDLCTLNKNSIKTQTMNDDMKGLYYYIYALRYMFEGDVAQEFECMSMAKYYCKLTRNKRRLIGLVTIECDIYEKMGNINRVILLLKKALNDMECAGFYPLRRAFLSNLGITYACIGEYANAIEYLSKSFNDNCDNLDLFYLVYSHMGSRNNKRALELLEFQYLVKCFDPIYYDLLGWCRQSLKRAYTKKCENLLQNIYKRYFNGISLDAKILVLKLLIDYYEHQQNYILICQYQKELINIMKGDK